VSLAKERGMIRLGGIILAACLIQLARLPGYALPPVMATLGFALYMFHNTLQTNATQTAEARGAAVSLFYSCFFVGQAIGAAVIGVALAQFPLRCGIRISGNCAARAGIVVERNGYAVGSGRLA
jgi:predicted MFS family arabinose efflux permease